uniref:histidine phosphatase family protein n=1 Tax=Sphingomonas sp. PL-96 TaxID=2887201 RepID=UPI00226C93B6
MRHGEPELAGRLLGRTDCAVLDSGVARCLAAAEALDVERVIASDLRRATDCAASIARAHGVPLHLDPRWRELDFGAWDGLSPSEVDAAALRDFWDDPDAAAPPGGERWSPFLARVAAALWEIEAPTLVVAHAGSIRAALVAACGFSRSQSWAFGLPYGCVLSLRIWRGETPTAQIVALRP